MAGGTESLLGNESCKIQLNGEEVHNSAPTPGALRLKIRELLDRLQHKQE